MQQLAQLPLSSSTGEFHSNRKSPIILNFDKKFQKCYHDFCSKIFLINFLKIRPISPSSARITRIFSHTEKKNWLNTAYTALYDDNVNIPDYQTLGNVLE